MPAKRCNTALLVAGVAVLLATCLATDAFAPKMSLFPALGGRVVEKDKAKLKSNSGFGILPSMRSVFACCKGTVVDAVDTIAGKPIMEEFLEEPVKAGVRQVKNYITDNPDLHSAARHVFVDALAEAQKRKKTGNKLTYKDAAKIARGSWDKLSMNFGLSDKEGVTEELPKPSRRLARRLARQFIGPDGKMNLENFQKYRKALLQALVHQTVDKRLKPRGFQYALGIILATALVAKGRTKLDLPAQTKDVLNFMFPSIVVGPLIGSATTFKLTGGSFKKLRHELGYATTAVGEARKTIEWTHDTLSDVRDFRSKVNQSKLVDAIGTTWNVFSSLALSGAESK
ncbi:hypothetical protein AAMO2058_001294800 [Amorphochlora amoebiformis]